jgi:hypothetical protein
LQFVHALLARPQLLQDHEPRRVAQRFEELGFEAMECLIHTVFLV